MKKRKTWVFMMVLSLVLIMTGCQSNEGEKEIREEGNQSESNVAENEISESDEKNLNMAIFWLDPNLEPTEGWNGWALTRCGIGENLVQIDEDLNFKPVLAEAYQQLDDVTYEFSIRENAKFQNGKPVTAEACKQSIERALNLTDRDDVKFNLESITADGQKLTFKLSEPDNIFINKITDTVFVIVDAELADDENFKYKPVCTGAFKVESFDADKGMQLSKNEYHWNGPIGIDTVNVMYIQDASTRAMTLQSGEIDFATQIEGTDLKLFEGDERFTVLKGANLRIFLLRLNMDKPYMKVKAFRQALNYGIDKKTYAESIVQGIDADGPFNSMLPFGYTGESYYAYSPEMAKQLLDEAGIVDTNGDGIREYQGENIVMKYYSRTNHGSGAKNIGTAMQAQYREIGLGLEVFQVENYSDIAQNGEFDMLWERWTSAPSGDPQYFFDASYKTGSAGNYGDYSNAEFDKICDELNLTADKPKREALGKEGSELLIEDVASLFMYYQEGNVVMNKNLTGVYRFVSEIYYIDDRIGIK